MPLYDYIAADKSGRKVKGSLEAENPRAARAKLKAQGLFPLELSGGSQAEDRTEIGSGRIAPKELAAAFRQLAILTGAGLPIVEALGAVVEESGPSRLGRVLGRVKDEVTGGRSLADSLELFPKVFSSLAVNMVRAGESSGTLEPVLERLAGLLENRVRLTGRVRAALAYPAFLIIVGLIVLTFLFSYVVPSVVGIFQESGRLLPLPTRILLAVSDLASSYGWLIGLWLAGLLVALFFYNRTEAGRQRLDKVRISLPIFGKVARNVVLARFSRTMATLLGARVSAVESLAIAGRVCGNVIYEAELKRVKERVEEGGRLAAELSRSKLFPPLLAHLTSAGEKSARLDTVFEALADGFEEDLETALTGLLSLLEPVVILAMGVSVGFIVISIMMPIFEMSSLVQ